MIEIVISETSAGRYLASIGDRILVTNTRTPLLCAARALVSEGIDPATTIAMRRATGPIAMTGRVGTLAGLTVHEAETPRFVRIPSAEMPIATPIQAHQRPTASNSSPPTSDPSSPVLEPAPQ